MGKIYRCSIGHELLEVLRCANLLEPGILGDELTALTLYGSKEIDNGSVRPLMNGTTSNIGRPLHTPIRATIGRSKH